MLPRIVRPLGGFLAVTAFCIAIAALLFSLGVTSPFMSTLVVSLCIGWSISGCSFLFAPWLDRHTNPILTGVLLTPLGLLGGLAAAGLVNQNDARAYLTMNDVALIISAFFAIVGYLIFAAQKRLSIAESKLYAAAADRQAQEKARVSAELKLLQAQIEPHFLFNTLSNIIELVRTEPKVAEQTLIQLTTLLRSSLDRTRQETTTLREELELVAAYLGIHQIRMAHRLRFRFEPELTSLDPSVLAYSVPPFLIQPLIENSIQHGIDPEEQGGEITVSVEQCDSRLIISVADTGRGIQPSRSGGVGVRNIKERLAARYGAEADLCLQENTPTGVRAILTLPYEALSGGGK